MKLKKTIIIIAGLLLLTSCSQNLGDKMTIETEKATIKIEEPKPTVENSFELVKSSGGIDEYRCMLNDLTVLLMEDHSAPVATFMVTYHVGSRNEAIGHTGATHLLEHMMFKGSKNFNKENNMPIWTVLQDVGANINATTSKDRTNYFELLPSEHLERAIAIEADRMRHLLLRDEDRQPEMTVVRNEFERGENEPDDVLNKNMWATAYQAHPYHHSTLGWRSDIEGVSTERLREFYDTFYWPNNATVTIIGDFKKDDALQIILDKYGDIPRSPKPIPEVYTTEPEQEGARRFVIKRSGQAGIVGIAHKTPEGLHADNYSVQVLSRILGGGKSSRLYKKIVDMGLATDIFMWDFPFRDNGLFIIYTYLTPDTKHEEVEKIILDEYELIKKNGVFDEEIKRAKGQIHAEQAFSRDGSYSIASNLNEAIATGDWTYYTNYLENIDKVTAKDIQRVAQTYLEENKSTTGFFIPEKNNGGGGSATKDRSVHQPLNAFPMDETFAPQDISAATGAKIADQIIEQAPLEGIRLLTMETGVEDVVTITGSFLGGDEYSPQANIMIADMTAAMLDQGTKNKTKFEIADKLETVGARMSFSSDDYRVRFNARCLKKDISLVIELLAEQLRAPVFNKQDLETLKTRTIGNLERSKESTRGQAAGEFLRSLYPEGHPNYSHKIDKKIELVKRVTPTNLKNYHKIYYGLGNMTIVAVGDVDSDKFSAEVKKAFKGWKESPLTLSATSATANKVSLGKKFVSMEDKTSTDSYIGLPIGIDRDHNDFIPLMVGTYILGGNFSARLMQTVRDEKGLTYGIASYVAGADDGNDGYWTVWGTFSPNVLSTGYEATIEQVKMWIENGVTDAELSAKKNTITGSYKVGLATTGGVAGTILTNAERGRANSYLDKMPEIINALSAKQINAAIKKYIDLNKLVFVAAGSIGKDGKPLGD